MSTNISLNSLIKGGRTRISEARANKVSIIRTNRSDRDLGILRKFFILLHRLQTMFAITSEHIISRKKSLKLQNIKKLIIIIENLKKKFRFNFLLFFLRIS